MKRRFGEAAKYVRIDFVKGALVCRGCRAQYRLSDDRLPDPLRNRARARKAVHKFIDHVRCRTEVN